jgi:hypothetical protein
MNLTKTNLLRTWQSRSLSILYWPMLVISVIAAAQGLLAGPKIYVPGGRPYIDYNNFRIFKFSFYHLVQGRDIYQLFPDDHWDLYKYSPGFALCFGLLSWMPDTIGLFLWNLINSLCLVCRRKAFAGLDDEKKSWILLFCLLEMLLSIQNTQSNGLMAGAGSAGLCAGGAPQLFSVNPLHCFLVLYKTLWRIGIHFLSVLSRQAAADRLVDFLDGVVCLAAAGGRQRSPTAFLYRSWLHLLVNDRSASVPA